MSTDALLLLEPARLAHVHDIRALDARVYPTPWSFDLWRRQIGRSPADACYVVASRGGRHRGHGGLLVQASEGHVVTVAVDPDGRGRGIASHLMAVLARRALALGLDALTLEVRLSNQPAQALYRRFGFAPAGIRPGYYTDDGEDALIMWRHGVAEAAFAERIDRVIDDLDPVQVHPALASLLAAPVHQDVGS